MMWDVEQRYGVAITLRDHLGILWLEDGLSLLTQQNYHMHPYCLLERDSAAGYDQACHQHCFIEVTKRNTTQPEAYRSNCWKGVAELIVPVWRSGQLQLTLHAGAFKGCKNLRKSKGITYSRQVKKAHDALPAWNEERAEELSRLLYIVGLGLLDTVEQQQLMPDENGGRSYQIRHYIRSHAHKCCTLEGLASSMGLSSSRMGQVVRDSCHNSFKRLLIEERLTRAKHLLVTTGLTQETIASKCGFTTTYYFNRLFTREVGVTPGQYRL